jgi:hypothetical protein
MTGNSNAREHKGRKEFRNILISLNQNSITMMIKFTYCGQLLLKLAANPELHP